MIIFAKWLKIRKTFFLRTAEKYGTYFFIAMRRNNGEKGRLAAALCEKLKKVKKTLAK